jgi:hypothetical protein
MILISIECELLYTFELFFQPVVARKPAHYQAVRPHVREAKVASEPETLIGWFRGLGFAVTRIGLEAGPLSQWLYAAMRDAGLAVELLETRHVRNAFKAMPVKTDRKDEPPRSGLHHEAGDRDHRCRTAAAGNPGLIIRHFGRPIQIKIVNLSLLTFGNQRVHDSIAALPM